MAWFNDEIILVEKNAWFKLVINSMDHHLSFNRKNGKSNLSKLTRYGAFYLYCGLAVIGWVVFLLFLPETKVRTLEQFESLFSGKLIVLNKK